MAMHSIGLSSSQMFVAHVTNDPRSGHVFRLNMIDNVWLLTAGVPTLTTFKLMRHISKIHCLNGAVQVLKCT